MVTLTRLKSAVGSGLPQAYLDLLAYSDGGEGPLAVQPYYFALDPGEVAFEAHSTGQHHEFFPGFFIFGSSGGGEFIALDTRGGAQPWPVVSIDMTNIDLAESVMPVAATFDAFLELVGHEAPEG